MNVPLTPLRCLERARDLFGDQEGIADNGQRFLYKDFADRAQRLAGTLLAAGLQQGEPVAFLTRNSHELLEGYFGVPLAGGLILPLNIRLVEAELASILRHSGTRFLFYAAEFTTLVEQLNLPFPIMLGDAYESLLAKAAPTPIDLARMDENAPASLFYTSGTTACPKGVTHSHRALYLHALSVALTFHIDDSTVELYTVPLFHANGWGRPHAATLMGARQVMLPRFIPTEVFRLIETERVTSMGLVPVMAEQLLAEPGCGGYNVSSMREIHLGGSTVGSELITRLKDRFQCLCTAGYGMTETGPVATTGRPKRGCAVEPHHAGWPVVGASVRLDVSGEVFLGGDHLMTGYWNEPPLDITWLETGDLATQDTHGLIHISRRKKDIIISGGENISAAEVENAITEHPSVRECAVLAVADAKWGEVPLACVVQEGDVTETELSEWLKGRISGFKIPKHWRFLPSPLPRTASGKLSKQNLKF